VHPDSKKALIILVNNINSYGEIGHKKRGRNLLANSIEYLLKIID
jgi:hypothetical protein